MAKRFGQKDNLSFNIGSGSEITKLAAQYDDTGNYVAFWIYVRKRTGQTGSAENSIQGTVKVVAEKLDGTSNTLINDDSSPLINVPSGSTGAWRMWRKTPSGTFIDGGFAPSVSATIPSSSQLSVTGSSPVTEVWMDYTQPSS